MKTTLKTLVVVMVIVLALAAFTACGIEPQPTTAPACEHTGGTATCEAAAVCEKCGESYGEKAEHTLVTVNGKEATCTEDGITEGKYCSVCMEVLVSQEVIPALGHAEVSHEAKEPTCTEKGWDAYIECSRCEYTTYVEKAALNHDIVKDAEKKPTCTETGLTAGEHCTSCDYRVEQNTVDALGHNEVSHEAKEPTCTEKGWDAYVTCSRCEYTTYVEKAALNHNIVKDEAKAPTCTETGLTAGEHCTRCDYKIEQQPIAANGHKDENIDYKCDVCNIELCVDHIEETLEAVAATCTTPGLSAGKKCSRCGHIIEAQVEIPAIGHAYVVSYEWSADKSVCTAKKVCSNDASHIEATETATVNVVTLNVTATKVTYTYAVEFANDEFITQTKEVEAEVVLENNIATINAPAIAGRVASHDYVKFGFHDAAATYTFTIYYSEVDVWDGVSVSASLTGSGTAEDPYLIQSGADLAYIAQVVNALEVKTAAFSGKYFVMTKSIDLNGHALHIGTGSAWGTRQMFAGYLDGNNCSIRGINNTLSLFGCVEGGWIKNLSLYGHVEVAKGNDSVGVLVGYNRLAPLENITNYASMNGRGNVGGIVGNMEQSVDTPATNLVNYGTITGVQNVGGIAGLIGRSLVNCTNWGLVSGDHDIGGIVGNLYWQCTLNGCVNYGTVSGSTVVGGIAGIRNGSIVATLIDCTNYGKALGTTCTSTSIDGITPAEATQTNCVNNGSVEIPEHEMTHTDAKDATCEENGNVAYDHCSVCDKNYDADGKVIANVVIAAKGHAWDEGVVANGKITFTCQNDASHTREETAKCTVTVNHLFLDGTVAAEAEALEFEYGSIATINAKAIEGKAASHDYVKVHVLENSSVTIYYSEVSVWDGASVSESLAGTGTAEDPFLIQSAADFAYFASQVNANTAASGANYKVTTFKGQYFKMTKSIDLNGHYLIVGYHAGWNDYQGFFGHFNGNNCSIRGINIDNSTGSTSTALFGCVNTGTLKNLSIYGSVKGNMTTGGLVAYTASNAVIENITSYVNVTSVGLSVPSDTKNPIHDGTVGGIVANQENSAGALLNCVNYGTVICDSFIVGGIVGSGGKDMTNCVNWGNVTGGNVSVGGISGSTKDKGTISGCVNYGTVTGATTTYGQIGGIVGTAKKPISDCVNYGTVIGTTSKGVGGIYGTTTSTVTNCVDNGEVKEYVPAE